MFGVVTRSRAFASRVVKVVNDVARQQFVATVNQGDEAVLGYEKHGEQIVWVHTDVPESCQGKGVGKLLAEYACNHALDNNLKVTCKCHFLANYYERNAEKYRDLKIEFDLEDEN